MSDRYRICLVCTGNICRSPMAEVALRSALDAAGMADRVEVDSAGTDGWHVGQSMDPRARTALLERGYDDHDHQARQFERTWFGDHDLVLALDSGHQEQLASMLPEGSAAEVALLRSFDDTSTELDVADPYYDGSFDSRLDEIEAACAGLVRHLRTHLRQ